MIKAKKSLGQNFLIDNNIISKILNVTDIKNKDILEIGPGTGNLTAEILKKSPKRLLVIEKDEELVKILKNNFNNAIEIINNMKKKGFKISGPYAADTAFLKNNRKNFDVIIGMYHDQVLTPIKTLFEYDAINITLGLPFLRISPDHGPNEKMMGKNLSNPLSLIQSIKFLDKN